MSDQIEGQTLDTENESAAEEKEEIFRFEATKDSPLAITTELAAWKFEQLGYSPADFYEHFPCFAGTKTLARFIAFHRCFEETLGLAGHIAEVGVFRGAVSMYLAKMSLLYEPHTTTQVHAFDWFREPTTEDLALNPDAYRYYEPFDRIREMIGVQGLQRYLLLHRINVLSELAGFFEENSHLQFRLVFLDAGDYDIVVNAIREFWPRLTNGGIMIFDQFNHEVAPGETRAIRDMLPSDAVLRTFQTCRRRMS
jgi:hypothetical protein